MQPAGDARDERVGSVGSFIWADRARVLAAAGAGDGGLIECELRGASMAGAIAPRSRLRIALGHGPFPLGEVVAFMHGGQLVVHRVVHRRGRLLVTRGDATVLPDPPVEAGSVLGRVVEAAPSGAGWQPVGPPTALPRRDRLLAALLLSATVLLMLGSAPLARRLAQWLQDTDERSSWTRTLLS